MADHTALIQADELATLLGEAPGQVVVCDCTFDLADHGAGRRAFDAGHVPGAVYLGLEDALSGAKTGRNGRHPLPDPVVLAERLAACGAGPDSQIVAYDAANGMFAARLWWLALWLGHARVAVLDGGLAAWRKAGHAVETAPPAPRPRGSFAAGAPLVATVNYPDVLQASRSGNRLIVDARAPDRFRGENETMDPVGGHIPGARNRFFALNMANGRLKSPEALREEFSAALAGRPAGETIAQCGSGVTACHNLLAMEVAGLTGAALYPGSWSEWSAQPGAPVATGEG